jgi:hypothetical protein
VSDLLPLRNKAGRNQQTGLFAGVGKICPASLVIKWLFPRGPSVRGHMLACMFSSSLLPFLKIAKRNK